MQALYQSDAAANFKQRYRPADPFDGVLVGAELLEISELVNIFKGVQALEDEGNATFAYDLIVYCRGQYQIPMVRVNQLWLDALRQRKNQICKYLEKAFFGFDSLEDALSYEQEIKQMNDPQLTEYLRQALEALAEAEVDSPTILIEQEAQ
jgi:hypothetical protein